MEWINVKDRLPEFELPVFVCDNKNADSRFICRLESITKSSNGQSHTWLEGNSGHDTWYYDVTHWMPLPEPPKD